MKNLFFLFSIISGLILQGCIKSGVATVSGTDETVWSEARYNAFTDLIEFNGDYYCVFREGDGHDSFDGKLRILKSQDARKWVDFSLLEINGQDLRDPHFFIDNSNILSVGSSSRNKQNAHVNVVFKLKNNVFFKSNSEQVDNDYWLWSFSKSKNNVYSIGYNLNQSCFNSLSSPKPKICLFNSIDTACINYQAISSADWINNSFECPCEASMVFLDDTSIVAIVRDEHTPGQSHIGISKKPFLVWQWKIFPYSVRGPKLALLPDGRIFLAAGALLTYDRTYYAILNSHDFSVEKIAMFPSGGDCGYPGVIIEGNSALISYYSSHEGDARVYIERIIY